MNITSLTFENQSNRFKTKKDQLKKLGIEQFNREISIFYKQNKNTNGIVGHDLITKIGCLITNKSISKIETDKIHDEYLFNKTVYMCDIELPMKVASSSLKEHIDKYLDMAKVTPTYAFSNSHIENIKDGTYVDLGLTIVNIDLLNASNFGKIEFMKDIDPKYREILNEFIYNPKFYNHLDVNSDNVYDSNNYIGDLEDFKDCETKIVYNTFGSESVDNFVRGVAQDGIYVGKRVIAISELIKDVFNKKLFSPFEELEFVYEKAVNEENINLTRLKTYSTFSKTAGSKYIEDSIMDLVPKLSDISQKLQSECNENLKLICGLTRHFLFIDVYFYSDQRTIRITKPVYKLYGEFALSSEDFINNVETESEFVKTDMLDTLHKSAGALDFTKRIADTICLVDNYTNQLKMLIEERSQSITDQIGGIVSRARIENTKQITKEDR